MNVRDPNYVQLNPAKSIFLQMVYDGEGTAQPNITVNGVLGTKVDSIPLGPAFWEYGRWQFELQPNPAEELIQISGNLEICEIVVDTICIPEPGTGLLVALGAGLVLVVRRRH